MERSRLWYGTALDRNYWRILFPLFMIISAIVIISWVFEILTDPFIVFVLWYLLANALAILFLFERRKRRRRTLWLLGGLNAEIMAAFRSVKEEDSLLKVRTTTWEMAGKTGMLHLLIEPILFELFALYDSIDEYNQSLARLKTVMTLSSPTSAQKNQAGQDLEQTREIVLIQLERASYNLEMIMDR